ncbi:MAG: hypothetical protein KGK17_01590 [Betaproteobacteria bacterium]|nr:hypothetical protein [Betaproteobacteria bacterium]
MFGSFNVVFVIFAIIAVNITMLAIVLQLDLLIFQSSLVKIIAWALAAGSWHMAYKFRNK